MRFLVSALAFVLALVCAPRAHAQTGDVEGWWRADITQGDETEPFFAHFDRNDEGAPRFRFSVPVARMHEVAGGGYELNGTELRLTGFGMTLNLDQTGQALDGIFPPTFVSGVEVPVHFVRAEAPAPPPELPTQFGGPPPPAWTASVGAEVWAGLVLDGRRALFAAADDGRVTGFAPRTGAQLWQADLGAAIRATPTLRGRALYVATDAALVALDARSGRRIWSAPFGAERAPRLPISDPDSKWDHYSSAPAVDAALAVVGSRDGCVYAFATRTGAQIWRTCTEALVTTTPALTRDSVFFGGFDHNAYALSRADGRELWRYDTHDAIPRDVAVAGDNVLFGSRSYSIFALNARTGAPAWRRHVWYSWIDSPPVLADGRIYTGTSDAAAVFAYDAATGAVVWKAPVPGWTWGGVALGAEALYTGMIGGRYSTPRTGGFVALGRADGAVRWMFTASPPADAGALYGFAAAPVVSGSRVFAADLSGTIYAFDDPERAPR